MLQTVILAGGKGTRLAARLNGQPKPLVMIAGKPLLQMQLENLVAAGVTEVVLLVNHRKDLIEKFIADHDDFGIKITLIDDGEPKGTGGALLSALDHLAEQFLVVYGDTLFNVDLNRFVEFHGETDAVATLLVHPNDHPADSDLIDVDLDDRILGFHPYPHPDGSLLPNIVNAAMYVMERKGLADLIPQLPPVSDLAKNVFPLMVANGDYLRAYNTPEYIKDIGTPDRLDRAEGHIASGKFGCQRLDIQQQAVFIDRDGTLNVPAGHLHHHDQLELYPDVPQNMLRLQNAQFRTVLISNQPVVARGDVTLDGMKKINAKLDAGLGTVGAFLDAKFMCFHHPDSGFEGEVAALKFDCDCRKPKPGLIHRAQKALNIDLANSWFIGDSTLDFGAAANAGVTSIGVKTGQGSNDGLHPFAPDVLVADFAAAVDFISGLSQAGHVTIQSDDAATAQGLVTVIKRHFAGFTEQSNTNGSILMVNPDNDASHGMITATSGQIALKWHGNEQEANT
jgi:histidinol-phosphate phosphatase family protein